jgi:cyclophilin family peptidyl-prolyl cis-trans isomerase/predicted DsbA family dithiol-disulfide isomerase
MLTSILPEADPAFPPVVDSDWQLGPKDATVTILEYSDFQCPYCAQVSPVLDDLLAKFPQDLRLVYRHFPLNIHDKSIISAQAAEAAGLQDKFWEMHTLLMSRQAEWDTLSVQDFGTWINEQAKTITGLDAAKFSQDLNSQPVVDKVAAALASAEQIGLNQTPFLILNGRAFGGNPDEATIGEVIRLFKTVKTTLEPIASHECPPQSLDAGKQYSATVTTTQGDFTIQLYADQAPLAVNSFIYLANRGWFNNTPFHRVIAGFVAQAGDPSGTGLGNPGYIFNDEIVPDLKYDKPGVVGMANSGPNTNGSQFFITYAAVPELDGGYTIFGQVTSGMDVVEKLTERDPQFGQTDVPEPDKILTVTIEKK